MTPNPSLQQQARPQFFVADMERPAAFFKDKLGFSIDYLYGQPPFYGLVSRYGVGLNLRHVPSLRERESLFSESIVVDGVEELSHEYQARHVDFAQMLTRQPWGTLDFIIRDPDGNLICFASRVTENV